MARIRTIKPEFFKHEGLFDAEKETGLPLRVAFAGLWTAADREGRFMWRPRTLKLDCLPHDDADFSRVLDALSTRGFIRKYHVDGVDYGCIPSWNEHQVINNREAASNLPDPSKNQDKSTTLTRAARVDDALSTPLVHALVEGKGREGKEIPPLPPKGEDGFDEFWAAYPKKIGKDAASKAFAKRRPGKGLVAEMVQAIQAQKQSEQWRKDGGQFIPHPATWLNQGRWQDESAGDESAANAKPGTPEYAKLHKDADWWRDAGFLDVWDANSSMCWAHNAHQFRNGKRAEVAA